MDFTLHQIDPLDDTLFELPDYSDWVGVFVSIILLGVLIMARKCSITNSIVDETC